MNHDLYPHQQAAIARLRAALVQGKRRPVLQLPTGAGKTITAAAIIESARSKGNRVVFTVPSIELIDQTVEALGAEGIEDIGVIQANHPLTDWRKPVQVASVQTLARRKQWPPATFVIVDEAHLNHTAITRWMADEPDLLFIGLSATPWAPGMAKQWDALLVPTRMQELIDGGYLSSYRVYGPSEPDLSKVLTLAGDYQNDQLADVMSAPKLVGDVVASWLRLGENRPTICFAVDRAHARKLCDEFVAAGVPAANVDGYTPKPERDAVRRAFADGTIKVVVNVGVLTTGVDWDCRCIVLARPTKSEMLYVQIVGRGLRTAPGKVDTIIIDHTGTTQRLGFVTDIHHDELQGGAAARRAGGTSSKSREQLPAKCPSCHLLKPIGVHVCPSCGFAPERQSTVSALEGDLVRLRGRAKKAARQEMQKFWSGLLWYCEDRGHKRGWAQHQFKEKFGDWPKHMHDVSAPPDAICRGWVLSSRIRYAKSMGRSHAA